MQVRYQAALRPDEGATIAELLPQPEPGYKKTRICFSNPGCCGKNPRFGAWLCYNAGLAASLIGFCCAMCFTCCLSVKITFTKGFFDVD
jgi:hypothetical protein